MLSVAMAMAPPAHAQDGALEEIIVTAERRATTLQSTPLSIIALTANTVEAKGIDDISDLALFTPNLSIMGGRTGGANAPTFTIRGIGGGGGSAGERGVGMYIDGIYVPRTAGSVFKVFDIERIEVLRGPQGTLFGRNSTGGAIRLFTKQPGDKFDAYVKGTLGNFDHHDIIGMINMSLGDKFAIRAQAGWLHEDGYVKDGPQMLGGSDDKVLRLQAKLDVTPKLSATFGVLYNKSKSDGNPQDIIEFDMRPGIEGVIQGNFGDWLNDAYKKAGQAPLAAYNDPRLVLDDYTAPDICLVDDFNPDWDPACALSNDSQYTQLDANIVWSLSEKTKLTLVSGWSQLIHTGGTDSTLLGFGIAPDNIKSQVIYQELQLNSSLFNDKVDVVVGANYFREKGTTHSYSTQRRGTSVFNATTGGTANGDGDAGLFVTGISTGESISNSFGLFLSSTWHITDKLNLTGGVRYAHDKKAIDNTSFGTPIYPGFAQSFAPAPGTDRTRVTADHSWNDVDWRGTIDYHFTDEAMVYGTVSKAYKAGAYSSPIQQLVPGPAQSGDFITPIPPEKVINYEAGARTTWFNKRLRINPTAFYMQWTNRQAARNTVCTAGVGGCPEAGFRVLLTNTGDIDVWGLEVDGLLSVTSRFNIDFALGLTDYKLKDPAANGGPNLFPSQASPTYNIGGTYNMPLGARGDLGFNISYSYVAAQETYPNSDSDSSYRMPSYGVVNGRISWRSPNRKIAIAAFANNLTNEHYSSFASSFGGGFWDAAAGTGLAAPLRKAVGVTRARPREFGVNLQYNF
ncbi:MAG: TonB-dependent receptor [Caulobacteraceae bacterium]